MMKETMGGVAAPKGFTAGGIHCGVKADSPSQEKDLAMILSAEDCAAAAVYTMNRVKASPIYITMEHLEDGVARGIIANSGNANSCAPEGHENAKRMCRAAAQATGLSEGDFVVASTGLIGRALNIAAIEQGMPALAAALSAEGSGDAAAAIMTSDTVKKEWAVTVDIDGVTVTIGAIAKGSGLLHPNMGTMLCFVTTDCAITQEMLQEALHTVVPRTFNRVTVDGEASTNDMCVVLANGMAENPLIEWKDDNYHLFLDALHAVCEKMAKAIAGDGEGATRLVTCTVTEARGEDSAERLAKAVVASTPVKAAMSGGDPNWGRVFSAMGHSKAPFRPEYVDISFLSERGEIAVCKGGEGLDFDVERARDILSADAVEIRVDLHEGEHTVSCWGCDLTGDYVKINSARRG